VQAEDYQGVSEIRNILKVVAGADKRGRNEKAAFTRRRPKEEQTKPSRFSVIKSARR
jgi:hypothetical protein